ncbi:MAG: hypothetical protein IJ692_02390 [Alloprevotella sp.]|nr:hypothetical protein [Alloprevotella sp.]
MDKFELQRLRDLPIGGVAGRLGLQVTRRKALCPFHDDHHASMTFKNNKYRCWSCGESGDTISLVMRLLGKDFRDACRWLADENNIIVSSFKTQDSCNLKPETWNLKPFDASRYERFFARPFLNKEAQAFLFEERRLHPAVVKYCRLTSWRDRRGTPWLQIPYYDREGRLTGVQNRNLAPSILPPPGEAPVPRFKFPRGSECGIYNLPVLRLLKPGEALYITEGASDCWAMLSAGHKAVAIPSATLLGRKDRELLAELSSSLSPSFHMYPDRDAPGERLFLRLSEVLPGLVRHELPPGCKDFGEYYVKVTSDK